MLQEDGIPKIFISYAWGSSDLVLELAQRLVSHGVEVVLDKWDLKEGQDKYAFMERCVNDSEITKVLIVCDKEYAQKANDRTGGVGDETVIISSEIYGNMKQEKFIPIIAERDEEGQPYVPTYIKTRIYIDLSDTETYEVEYEKLLRNIYEKGLCTRLIQNLIEGGKKRGLGRIDLSATKEGYPIYKKVGFVDKEYRYTDMTYKFS